MSKKLQARPGSASSRHRVCFANTSSKRFLSKTNRRPSLNESEAGWRLPRFSINPFFLFLLHGFWASAFARNPYSLARLTGEFSDGFLTVIAATAMLYWLRSALLQ